MGNGGNRKRVIKPIALYEDQIKQLLEIKDEIGYGTLTMIVRDAVDYYIENEAHKSRIDIYKETEE